MPNRVSSVPSPHTRAAHFTAEGELLGPMRLLGPIVRRLMAREFAGYHRNLARNVEAR